LSKEKYRELCRIEGSIPIFSKDWWMDAVCGEDNWEVLVVERNGEIVASMPFFMRYKYGLRIITQPKLTQTNGVWIKYPHNQSISKKLSYEMELMNEIINQIERLKVDYFCQNWHYSLTNWQPFYWKGFQQTTRYTFVLDDLTDLGSTFGGFSKVVRKNINRAKREAIIYDTNDIEKFYEMNKKVFGRQGINIPYSFQLISQLDAVCRENTARKIFCAEDSEGRLNAMLYLVWDENSAYLLASGTEPELRDANFKTLLVWKAIEFASKVTNKFDFEGSMIKPIAEYFAKFGGKPKPYFQVSRGSRRYRFLSAGREMLHALFK
jgi:hypothetical protein